MHIHWLCETAIMHSLTKHNCVYKPEILYLCFFRGSFNIMTSPCGLPCLHSVAAPNRHLADSLFIGRTDKKNVIHTGDAKE